MVHPEALFPVLARNHLFSVFTEDETRRLLEVADLEIYSDGICLFSQGEPPDKFYLILSGAVAVAQSVPRRADSLLAELAEGETIGEMSFLDRFPRSATAVTRGETRLLSFDFPSFDALLASDKELAVKWFWLFGRALSQRLREANERMKTLVQQSVAPGEMNLTSG